MSTGNLLHARCKARVETALHFKASIVRKTRTMYLHVLALLPVRVFKSSNGSHGICVQANNIKDVTV